MKKLKVLSVILLMLFLITGCKQTEQKGNMMKLELNCDAENGYLWQTTILNSNVIKSVGDEFLYKDQDNVLETVQKITFKALEAGSAEIEIKYINTSKEDKENEKLTVLIDFFGQETPVEVDLIQVSKRVDEM